MELTDQIGSGISSVVYLSRSLSGEEHAVKIIKSGREKNAKRELICFKQFKSSCPNVIKMIDHYITLKGNTAFVLEYIPNTLKDVVTKKSIKEKLEIMLGIARGLDFIHTNGVLHRDIKPDNILVRTTGEPVIIDFSLSVLKNSAEASVGKAVGSYLYVDPIYFKRYRVDDWHAADVYSLGLVFWYILTGEEPYPLVRDKWELERQKIFNPYPGNWTEKNINKELKLLIKGMTMSEPKKRFCLKKVLLHLEKNLEKY